MAEVVSMPKLGFDMAEGILVRWVIQEGEKITKGGVLAEIETDKATVEVESAHEGVVLRHLAQENDVVPVGKPIAVIGAAGEEVDLEALVGEGFTEPVKETPSEKQTPSEAKPEKPQPEKIEEEAGEAQLPAGMRASPLARRMAEQQGVDLTKVEGSGPGGRIVRADIEAFLQAVPAFEQPAKPPAVAVTGAPAEDRRIPLNKLRAAIGRRMVEAKQNVPHFYLTFEYNMAALMELRKQLNAMLPESERLSVNDFIVKAVALTLRDFPNLNALLDGHKGEIVHKARINIGVAVAVDNGLLTVVCQDTDLKPLRQISTELRAMTGRAREGKVKPDDIEGSTFSVSNLGMFNIEHFIAIINPPEAAILAVGSVRQVPIVMDGEIKPGLRMKATISVDHRVSDGAEAARFLQALAEKLEQPLSLLL